MTEIEFGIDTAHIQEAAAFIIGYYFDHNDYGENLKAFTTNNNERGHLSNGFGDKNFIHYRWEGPSYYGTEQIGEANARLWVFTNGKYDEEREQAMKSLINIGGFVFNGFREVAGVNEEHVETCSKLFGEDRIQDIVRYVNTKHTNPDRHLRVYVKATPWSEHTSRYQFIALDGNMGYGWK